MIYIYTVYMYMNTSGVFHLTLNKERHIGQFQWWNSFLAAVHHLLRCEPLRLARYRHGHTVCAWHPAGNKLAAGECLP